METETGWCPLCGTKFVRVLDGVGRGFARKWCSDRCRKTAATRRNKWKNQDSCPRCGGPKTRKSKTCRSCMGANNPLGINGR